MLTIVLFVDFDVTNQGSISDFLIVFTLQKTRV